jgi:hypothetical protein
LFAWGAGVMILANRSYHGPSEGQHRGEKVAHLSGAMLLAVGFGLQLVSAIAH